MIFLFGYLIKKECSLIIKTLITRSRLQLNAVAHQTNIKTTAIYLHVSSAHKAKIPNPLDTLDDS